MIHRNFIFHWSDAALAFEDCFVNGPWFTFRVWGYIPGMVTTTVVGLVWTAAIVGGIVLGLWLPHQ